VNQKGKMPENKSGPAVVVGSGPNGLAAAITLAQAGLPVTVYEKNEVPGGACRSSEIIKPGYVHDTGSAVHPLAIASPFFQQLQLENHGLKWIRPEAALAHPFDDGTAVLLHGSVADTAAMFDSEDGKAYHKLLNPLVEHWEELIDEVTQFPRYIIHNPSTFLRFGTRALKPAASLARDLFSSVRARGFIAGLGVHSVMDLEQRGSMAAGLVLASAAHIAGWPLPEGGSQKITDALADYLSELGGNIVTKTEIESLEQLPPYRLCLLDVTPRQFLNIAGKHLRESYKNKLKNYRYGPGVFKVDWILDGSIPWKARECLSAGTVHVGGHIEEIIVAEGDVMQGRHPEKPFVILVQPSIFDATRVQGNGHIAWGYCHVPNGSSYDMAERIEAQIERFAPSFKDRIVARYVMSPSDLQEDNPNCIGGDITGGAQSLMRMVLPRISHETPIKNVFLCSATTPPGPGVHGICGIRAAQLALKAVSRAF
jgi:phytoene dehydrogenase-like protein